MQINPNSSLVPEQIQYIFSMKRDARRDNGRLISVELVVAREPFPDPYHVIIRNREAEVRADVNNAFTASLERISQLAVSCDSLHRKSDLLDKDVEVIRSEQVALLQAHGAKLATQESLLNKHEASLIDHQKRLDDQDGLVEKLAADSATGRDNMDTFFKEALAFFGTTANTMQSISSRIEDLSSRMEIIEKKVDDHINKQGHT